MDREVRKSGLPSRKWEDPFEFELSDLDEFLNPYLEIGEELDEVWGCFRKRVRKAYIVQYDNAPELFFITFTSNRYKAKGNATKFFRDNLHPLFIEGQWRHQHLHARTRLHPEFDKYNDEMKVPIPELMKIGLAFPCSVCGKGNFKTVDYENKGCFIIEGEGDLNPFTKGYCLCRDCYNKYYKTSE